MMLYDELTSFDQSPVPILASTAQGHGDMANDVPDRGPTSEFQKLTGSYTDGNESSSSRFFNESSLSMLDLDDMRDARMSASLIHVDQSSSDHYPWQSKIAENNSLQNSVNKSSLKDITNAPTTPADYAKIAAKFLMPSSDSQISNDTLTATPAPTPISNLVKNYQKENLACAETAMDSSATKHLEMSSAEPKESLAERQHSTPVQTSQSGAESMVYALDFLDDNFQDELQMQQEFLQPEEFLDGTQTNIEKLFDQEEEIFVEENKFMLQSHEHISPNRTDYGFQNASTLSTATIASAKSNMSIGEYMNARSEKLGELGGEDEFGERPSFGMNLISPPSRKPMPLLSQQAISPSAGRTVESKGEGNISQEHEKEANKTLVEESLSEASSSEDAKSKTTGDTPLVDISMMSISEAISNMSVNMNNEQLANMLMEIAKQKHNERKKKTSPNDEKQATRRRSNNVPRNSQVTENNPKNIVEKTNETTANFTKKEVSPSKQMLTSRIPISHNSTLNMRKTISLSTKPHEIIEDKHSSLINQTADNDQLISSKYTKESNSFFTDRDSVGAGKFVQEVKPISRTQTPETSHINLHTTVPTHDDSEVFEIEREDVTSKQSIQEEFPSLLNSRDTFCFSDDNSAKEILSSTRTDFSLLKGSLSRESIEHLHKMLREKGYTQKESRSLKEYLSPRDSVSSSGKSDVFEEQKPWICEGEIASERSSPRCSDGFEQLAARMSLANMETLVDSDFNELYLKDTKKLEVIQEVSNEDVNATQSTVACDDSSNSDSQGGASTDSHPTLKINPPNVQSSTLLNPLYQNPMMFRPPGHENMHASLPPNFTTGVYRPVSPMEGAFHIPLPPRSQPTLLTGQSLMTGPMAQEYLARSLPPQGPQYYPSVYHQTAPYHMQHYHTNVPSTIAYAGEHSNLSSGTTSSGFNHSGIPHHQYRNLHPYYPASHSIDLGMHDHYYRSQRPSFSEGRNVISVPSEITFSGVRCASIVSTTKCSVTNNSEQSVQVELNIISPTINCCFNAEGKDRIAPRSSKSYDIIFTPNCDGHFKAVLEVSAFMVGLDGKPVKVHAAKVNVSAQAVVVDAEIKKGITNAIDFKESLAGTRKALPFKIANNTPAELPVCVFLCGMTGQDKAFSISKSAIVEDSLLPQAKSMEMLCITLPPNISETTLWVHCHVSTDQCDSDQPPKELSATLYMQIDRQCMVSNKDAVVLDTLSIKALACIAKLRAPKSMQPLTFTCPKNDTQVQRVPVKNCGNIRIKINFSLQNNSLFLLSPTHCELSAGETTDLSVTFQPLMNTPSHVTNTLYMIIEENKSHFEVMIVAKSIMPNPYNKNRASVSDNAAEMPILFANKSFLNWGGVDVGKTMQKIITLRTSKEGNHVLPLRISIKGNDASCFQLMSSEANSEQLSLNMEATVKPSQDKELVILFSPTNCSLMNANLEIKTPLDNARFSKFTVPLSGYGGKSDIRFEGVQILNTSNNFDCFFTFSQNNENKMNEKNVDILVKNNGSRDAFVKATFYCDLDCRQALSDGSVTCSPSQFILSKKTARSISVTFRNLRTNLHVGKDGHDLLACMRLWHGDEISRQLFKHALKTFGPSTVNKYLGENNSLREISFDSIYHGEDDKKQQELSDVTSRLWDVQMFYNNLQKAHVQLLGDGTSSEPTFKTLFKALDAFNKPPQYKMRNLRDSLDHNPVKERASSNSKDDGWDLSPDHVVLNLSHKMVAETTKVKIINRLSVPLKFDSAWPGHYLSITPHSGCVDPESVFVLLLSANPSLSSRKDMLPWIGAVQIVSREGRGTRQIRVQICDGQKDMSPEIAPKHCPSITNETFATPLPSMGPKCNTNCVRKESSKKRANQIVVKSSNIMFPHSRVRCSSNSNLEFTNVSKVKLRWILTSFAPAYVKASGGSGDLLRSTYAAFVFSHTSGILEPGTKMNIPVSFNPMNEGSYSQFWDLEFHESSDTGALSLDKIRLQLTGEGIQSNSEPATVTKPKIKEDIYVLEECLDFSEVCVGSSLTKKIPINNRSRESHNVRFVNVSAPFHITHQKHTIRGKYYASLPITFRPTKAGEFVGELFIQPEHTPLLRVKLIGTGV